MIYLYLKTHKDTGLKYLGKTEQDPHGYDGSGIDWLKHIKKHGNDVCTEVLFESDDKFEFRNAAIEYSIKFDIVASKDFANRTIEEGQGGGITKGWTCITDGKTNRRIPPGIKVPSGWRKGMKKCQHPPMRWINDGSTSKLVLKNADLPDGFCEGRLIPKGKSRWVTDGNKNIKLPIDDVTPNGFRNGKCGRSVKGYIWINNGKDFKRQPADVEIPAGWAEGKFGF